MKNSIYVLCLSLLVFMSCSKDELIQEQQTLDLKTDISAAKGKESKIMVCHYAKSDNTWEALEINSNALDAHLRHGDAVDMDGDGYYNQDNGCSETDCDDTDAAVNPGAEEICDNGIDDNCNGETDENCAQPAAIGDIRDGGVVFWVDPTDNTKGLVVALSDAPTNVQWGCYFTDLPSVPNVTTLPPSGDGAEIGDGMSNTNAILADCPTAPAALAARSNGPEWFLPSAKELREMYLNKATLEAVPGFSAFSSFYWSSTENNSEYAWLHYFYFGLQGYFNKDGAGFVRAVRAF